MCKRDVASPLRTYGRCQRAMQRGTHAPCTEYRHDAVDGEMKMDNRRGAKVVGWVAACGLLMCLSCCARAVECRTPLLRTPPTLDGRIDPKEWAGCAGFDGFLWEGQLERRRIHAYVGATATHLYIALLSQLPAQGDLLTQVTTDNLKLVYDNSVEVWVDPAPDAERGRAYQLFANAAGHTGYCAASSRRRAGTAGLARRLEGRQRPARRLVALRDRHPARQRLRPVAAPIRASGASTCAATGNSPGPSPRWAAAPMRRKICALPLFATARLSWISGSRPIRSPARSIPC